jgi:hypothetical protein
VRRSAATEQREWKQQPVGRSEVSGTSPEIKIRSRLGASVSLSSGTTERRALVGVKGFLLQSVGVAKLHDLAQIHNTDPIRNVTQHSQIMHNEDVR